MAASLRAERHDVAAVGAELVSAAGERLDVAAHGVARDLQRRARAVRAVRAPGPRPGPVDRARGAARRGGHRRAARRPRRPRQPARVRALPPAWPWAEPAYAAAPPAVDELLRAADAVRRASDGTSAGMGSALTPRGSTRAWRKAAPGEPRPCPCRARSAASPWRPARAGELDHVTPRKHGGGDAGNVRPAHAACNASKGAGQAPPARYAGAPGWGQG